MRRALVPADTFDVLVTRKPVTKGPLGPHHIDGGKGFTLCGVHIGMMWVRLKGGRDRTVSCQTCWRADPKGRRVTRRRP